MLLHRPWLATAFLLLTSVAGCLDQGSDPDPEPAEQAIVPDDAELTAHGNVSIERSPAQALQRYTFALANQTYEEEIIRYAIVATAPTVIDIDWEIQVGTSESQDDCIVGAVNLLAPPTPETPIAPDGSTADPAANGTVANGTTDPLLSNAFIGVWAAGSRLQVAAEVEGNTVATPEMFGNDGAGSFSGGATGSYSLLPGGRLIVEMGGRSMDYGHTNNTAGPYVWTVSALAVGETYVEALPSRAVRCGVGPYQGEGGIHGHAWIASAAQERRVAMETGEESTALLLDGSSGGTTAVWLDFLGDRHEATRALAFSAPTSGPVAIDFERWADTAFGASWMIADVHWPAVEQLAT